MKLYINTLGEFDIKSNDSSILMQSSRTYKLYKLFEYFLTFRNKKLLPENIIDNLLSESESDDPKNILRTQIFRLRKIIKSFIQDEDESKSIILNFKNGYYCLEIGENVTIDTDEFEDLIKRADIEREYNTETAVEIYEKALKLYKGLYLSDNAYEVWLVPTRNYYQRLYLKTLYKLIEILKEYKEYEKIMASCEEALLIEPYEESIHIYLMESMLKLGQTKAALHHYEYALNLLQKEMDVQPSVYFTEMQYKIQNNTSTKTKANSDTGSKLDDGNMFGALHCSADAFKFLFNLQKRKSQRNQENDYLCTINIIDKNNVNTSEQSKQSRSWKELLENSLRKGDVFTFWSRNQILVLLHNVREPGISVMEKRIKNNMMKYERINKIQINMIFQPISDSVDGP
ncbi:bacterial transcriptional activator domain-containing protein [Sedimentibacter sp.]|uniref:bacterial transcriptional activator domain-containing protein n=1 Tax=Sedimentibacter sp. TaxID=1960295 RepID=UPI0028A6FB6E|nr:bacterial transcriptional activator domain-containing protein [Sedimentibacter sp.]